MMKGQKGITLVALIITIIVMLILVGVSISVALNGDLFGKATSAVDGTKEEQVKEAITLAKTDIFTKYYDPNATAADKAAPTGEIVKGYINNYLDVSVQVPSVANINEDGEYVVTAPTGVELSEADLTMTFGFWAQESNS